MQVCISFAKILFNVTRPHTAILGNIPGTTVYRNVAQYLEATSVPGILAIRIDSAVYFSNSAYIQDKVLGYLEKQRLGKTDGPKVRYLVIDLTRKIHMLVVDKFKAQLSFVL
jgi:high affinity sulfate transporter 1